MAFFEHPFSGVAAIFENMPLISGKLLLGGLLLVFLFSWGVILAKLILFLRMKFADRRFSRRLRLAGSCLEVYKEEWGHRDASMMRDVYRHGARAAFYELFGTSDRRHVKGDDAAAQVRAGPGQMKAIRDGFADGEVNGLRRLISGLTMLRNIGVFAPVCGLLGGLWLLARAFLAEDGGVAEGLFQSSLMVFVLSVVISLTALVSKAVFVELGRNQTRRIRRFRHRMEELFHRELMGAEPPEREGDEPFRSLRTGKAVSR